MNAADRILIELGRSQKERKVKDLPAGLTIQVALRSGASYTSRAIVRHKPQEGFLELTSGHPHDASPIFIVTAEIESVRPHWHR